MTKAAKSCAFTKLVESWLFFAVVFLSGCTLIEDSPRKNPPAGFIVTPPSFYSTTRARHLGEKYHRNLEQLVQQLVKNPVTSKLQFANNLLSIGGIGFFTHSATKTPDQRYLEVILGLPEVLEVKADFDSKIDQVFAQYGRELLTILSGDQEIYGERDVAGYGLNLSWRSTSQDVSASRVSLERVVIYISKEQGRGFLKRQMTQDDLLAESVIFGAKDEGPIALFSYGLAAAKRKMESPLVKETKGKEPEVTRPKPEPVIGEIEVVDLPSPPSPPVVEAPKKEKTSPRVSLATPAKEKPAVSSPPKVELQKRKELSPAPPSAPVAETVRKETPPPGPPVTALKRAEPAFPSPPETEVRKEEESTPPPSPPTVVDTAEKEKSASFPPVAALPKKEEAGPSVKSPEKDEQVPAPKPEQGKKDKKDEPKAEQRVSPKEKSPPAGKDQLRQTALRKEPETTVKPKELPRLPQKELSGLPGDKKDTPVDAPGGEQRSQERIEERLARLKEKDLTLPTERSMERLRPKPLQGYVIQLSFRERGEAERWSENLTRDGYATSISIAGENQPVRLRVGNFPSAVEAKDLLSKLEKRGLAGSVLQVTGD